MTPQSALNLTSDATANLMTIPANPAIDLPLQGLHLIEASAGTGKTWTLATLMVRLIVEGKFFTRQMQSVDNASGRDYRGSMLIIVKNWNIHEFTQFAFNYKTFWSLNIF